MSEYVVRPPHVALSWAIRKIEADMPGRDPEWVAQEALRRMKAAERQSVLVHYVQANIEAERRAEARRVEQRAYRQATAPDRQWRREYDREKVRIQVEDPVEYRKRWPTIGEAIDDFRRELKLELTAELLATSFSVGNGRSVTWGRATVDDHRRRSGMLATQAAGTLQTAALHEEAVAVIEAAGASCLSEVKLGAVAA